MRRWRAAGKMRGRCRATPLQLFSWLVFLSVLQIVKRKVDIVILCQQVDKEIETRKSKRLEKLPSERWRWLKQHHASIGIY